MMLRGRRPRPSNSRSASTVSQTVSQNENLTDWHETILPTAAPTGLCRIASKSEAVDRIFTEEGSRSLPFLTLEAHFFVLS
jgi:hypothetical protein